jgi:hypothetical protein
MTAILDPLLTAGRDTPLTVRRHIRRSFQKRLARIALFDFQENQLSRRAIFRSVSVLAFFTVLSLAATHSIICFLRARSLLSSSAARRRPGSVGASRGKKPQRRRT